VLDTDTGSEWRIRKDEQWQVMMQDKWADRVAYICVEVVAKQGYETHSSVASQVRQIGIPARSGVTSVGNVEAGSSSAPNDEGIGDTCTSPPPPPAPAPAPFEEPIDDTVPVDWATLTIIGEEDQDGEANAIADEEKVYEAMGFTTVDERAEEAAREEIPIPAMSKELQQEMDAAAIPVDDRDPSEPMYDWDRDNPDMSVGTRYPSMYDFRLAVRQHAIVKEFELGTEKSDPDRFRGYCRAAGCPWKIRARTQHDKSVRVLFFTNCYCFRTCVYLCVYCFEN
jgi:hypothetical protein